MDLSLFFAGTAGSIPTARRGLPALLVRRGADRILFDCGEGTQRQLGQLGGSDGPHRDLPHPLPRRPLARAARAAEDLRSARARSTAGRSTARAACASSSVLALRAAGRVRFELELVELEPGRDARAGRLRDRRGPGRASRAGLRLRALRGRASGRRSTRRRPGARARPRAPTSAGCSAARRSHGVGPEQVMGPARPGRKLVVSGDTRPCEALRIAAHRRRRARPRGDVRRGGGRPGAETGHSTATRRRGWPVRPRSRCSR